MVRVKNIAGLSDEELLQKLAQFKKLLVEAEQLEGLLRMMAMSDYPETIEALIRACKFRKLEVK